MEMRQLVRKLDLGNSVAEFDESLNQYFVETEAFRRLVQGKVDVIAGDKGTGKTALFTMLQQRYSLLDEMKDIEVITGFNPSGNPVFQRLAQQKVLSEGQYVTVWKAYILSLVGNWLLDLYEDQFTENMKDLDVMLTETGLRSADDSAQTVFSKIMNTVGRVFSQSSVELQMTLSESGIPILVPKVEFGGCDNEEGITKTVPHEKSLRLLNSCLEDSALNIWVVLDRLDEAFQGFPETETPALRALFRTYLDLKEFGKLSLKLFVRRDLFRKITKGGFVNLTHVNARKIEIVWDEEDLLHLLCARIRGSSGLVGDLEVDSASDKVVFDSIFQDQVDSGEKKPKTWKWMMSRIRDGNDVKPPRNLIDLVGKAREMQLRREDRDCRIFESGKKVIEADSLKRALSRLSSERVEDTLLAEAGDLSSVIEKFRGSKAEHNFGSIAKVLNRENNSIQDLITSLEKIGFLEALADSYKIPMLYREGLDITQGKAF